MSERQTTAERLRLEVPARYKLLTGDKLSELQTKMKADRFDFSAVAIRCTASDGDCHGLAGHLVREDRGQLGGVFVFFFPPHSGYVALPFAGSGPREFDRSNRAKAQRRRGYREEYGRRPPQMPGFTVQPDGWVLPKPYGIDEFADGTALVRCPNCAAPRWIRCDLTAAMRLLESDKPHR